MNHKLGLFDKQSEGGQGRGKIGRDCDRVIARRKQAANAARESFIDRLSRRDVTRHELVSDIGDHTCQWRPTATIGQ